MDTSTITLPAALGPLLAQMVASADLASTAILLTDVHALLGGQIDLYLAGINDNQPFALDRLDFITTWADRSPPRITTSDLPANMTPLIAAERVLGGIRSRAGDGQALALIVPVLTSILERYRLLMRQQNESVRRNALARLSLSANGQTTVLSVLRAAYEAIRESIDCDTFLLNVFNPSNQRFEVTFTIDRGEEFVNETSRPMADNLSSWIVRHRQSLHFADLEPEVQAIPDINIGRLGTGDPSRAWLGVPMLLSDGRSIGVVSIQRYTMGLFSETDVRFAEQIAATLAVSVEKMLIIQERDHQIAVLEAQAILSTELGRVRDVRSALTIGMNALRRAFDAVVSVILTFEPNGTLGLGIAREGDQIDLREPRGIAPTPGGFSSTVQRTRQTLLCGNATEMVAAGMNAQPVGDQSKPRTQSLLATPLLGTDGSVIGALSVQDYATFAFTTDDVVVIEQMARQLALVIENAGLLEKTQQQLAALQAASVTQQSLRSQVRALSAPIVPVYEQILVMPLVGGIDDDRAQEIIERLLQGVTEQEAAVVLLDITGVEHIDTTVANYILQAAAACRLVGAEVILTGIAPAVAQTIVHLGMSLGAISTSANLQTGLALALARIGRRIG